MFKQNAPFRFHLKKVTELLGNRTCFYKVKNSIRVWKYSHKLVKHQIHGFDQLCLKSSNFNHA